MDKSIGNQVWGYFYYEHGIGILRTRNRILRLFCETSVLAVTKILVVASPRSGPPKSDAEDLHVRVRVLREHERKSHLSTTLN